MTIHKSKGKEFDQVIIYEGSHQGRIVPSNATEKRISQARLMLRVGVTRAKDKVTIFTPKADPCHFLYLATNS
jgi:DNA helicase-2/ATP-dependent DNA helicase PcrA